MARLISLTSINNKLQEGFEARITPSSRLIYLKYVTSFNFSVSLSGLVSETSFPVRVVDTLLCLRFQVYPILKVRLNICTGSDIRDIGKY